MNKLDFLNATNPLHDAVEALCEAQDAATMQIFAIAKLARQALDSELDESEDHAGYALDAIMRIAVDASAHLDVAQIALGGVRLAAAARAEAASPFGRVHSFGVQ